MESKITLSQPLLKNKINNPNIEIEPVPEKSISFFNCGINTEKDDYEDRYIKMRHDESLSYKPINKNVIEHERIQTKPSQDINKLNRKIKHYHEKESKAQSTYNKISCAKSLLNITGNTTACGLGLLEGYSIAVQNVNNPLSLNIVEFVVALGSILFVLVLTKTIASNLEHKQRKYEKESSVYHEVLIKLENEKTINN